MVQPQRIGQYQELLQIRCMFPVIHAKKNLYLTILEYQILQDIQGLLQYLQTLLSEIPTPNSSSTLMKTAMTPEIPGKRLMIVATAIMEPSPAPNTSPALSASTATPPPRHPGAER